MLLRIFDINGNLEKCIIYIKNGKYQCHSYWFDIWETAWYSCTIEGIAPNIEGNTEKVLAKDIVL